MINLTIQSANIKDVNITSITDFASLGSISNNQTIQLPYDNILLTFHSNVSTISFTNFINNLNALGGDYTFYGIIGFLIVACILFVKVWQ